MEDNNWTKNKILMFVLYWVICCFCIWIFVVSTLADDSGWLTKGQENQLQSGELNLNSAIVMTEEVQTDFDFSKYYVLQYVRSLGTRDGVDSFFIPKDYIMVREFVDGDLPYYDYRLYSYDGYNLVPERFMYNSVVEVGHTSCYTRNYEYRFIGVEYDVHTDCPFAINEEYALKYFQTMDSSFLENGDSVVIPEPQNVSCYFASE